MLRTAFNLTLVGSGAVAASLALLTGCGTSAAQPSPTTSSPRAAATTSTEPEQASSECSEAIAAIAKASGGGELSAEHLDALGAAAPQSCGDLADLRTALDSEFDPGTAESLTGFVISACVAGDAWATLGQPSTMADTALCKEARSQYTVGSGRRLLQAKASFADYFDGPCQGWSTDKDARVSLSCVDGAYRILVRNPDRPQHSRLFASDGQLALSVEADAVLVKPNRGEFEAHGVSCWTTRSLGYLFVLAPDGSYAIIKGDPIGGTGRILKQGQAEYALPGRGVRNRIRGDCQVADGDARLALYVNGDRVAAARDKSATKSFIGYGLFVATSERNTEVRFDNVLVRGGES
jgi:hypothetical protein